MCIFNRPVHDVSGTRIFVTETQDGRQLTCYQNYVKFGKPGQKAQKPDNDSAMILPFPVKKDSQRSEPLALIDLSKCGDVVEKMEEAFPTLVFVPKGSPRGAPQSLSSSLRKSAHLAVVQVGSYSCSVAKNLADLRKIDPTVFKVAEDIDALLAKHYSEGFGFLVCKLNAEGKQHPIAYIHEIASDGQLFVPCRHEHGDKEEKQPHWDHYIYSSNATDSKVAGNSVEEEAKALEAEAAAKTPKPDPTKVEGSWVVKAGKSEAGSVLGQLPVNIVKPGAFRRLRVNGKHDNQDLLFGFKHSDDKLARVESKPTVIKHSPAKAAQKTHS